MPDARFASIKTDPRFRRPKKQRTKVVLDDRFKDLLEEDKKAKKKRGKKSAAATRSVDKYGRTLSETQDKDDLRRFYRLETEQDEASMQPVIDYARGAVLMESSDEEEEEKLGGLLPRRPSDGSDSDSDQDGFVSLGVELEKSEVDDEGDLEIDLDENTIATLDAQVAEYTKTVPEQTTADGEQTRRLAVVNLDWDHVRAAHLYKIFASLVSPTAPMVSTSARDKISTTTSKSGVSIARGKILSVHVYPSEFGKKRMTREEKEGPPTEVFKKKNTKLQDEDINEKTIIEIGNEVDYDEDALRKYQLERLRYYYAIVECDTVEAAVHVYNELEGSELERSANVFDLSFVPDDMVFDDEPRDEATQVSNRPYKAVEFTTDALRHSKVKLTWDEDDPERVHFLRRSLTKKEIEEADFRAYIASSSSSEGGSEDDEAGNAAKLKNDVLKAKKEEKGSKKAEKNKLRALLVGGNDDELPEGWGDVFDNKENRRKKSKTGGEDDSDVDMEVTFMPGLSETKNPEDENTLEKYQRKMKEKRKKRKEEAKKRGAGDDDNDDHVPSKSKARRDEFFGAESDSQHEDNVGQSSVKSSTTTTNLKKQAESSKAELALLAASDNPIGKPAHFDMKAVLKAEKQGKKSRYKSKKRAGQDDDVDGGPGETQDDFVIDVKDDRFTALHDDHQFAIDPTHPQFKKTKSMTALLSERSKRQKDHSHSDRPRRSEYSNQPSGRDLRSLVESVKRKSSVPDQDGFGKRRKLGKT